MLTGGKLLVAIHIFPVHLHAWNNAALAYYKPILPLSIAISFPGAVASLV